MRLLRPIAPLLALLLSACGGSSPSQSLGLPEHIWTWVDVPGAICSDGSPTGLAVNPGSGDTLVLFLNGGGACWDPITCGAGLAQGGPYRSTQFQSDLGRVAPGSIVDRGAADAIYGAGATLVFLPYCTGDVDWGKSTNDYPGVRTWHHAGQPNLAATSPGWRRGSPRPRGWW